MESSSAVEGSVLCFAFLTLSCISLPQMEDFGSLFVCFLEAFLHGVTLLFVFLRF